VLISVGLVALLVGLLLPALIHARTITKSAVCAANLKQLGVAWTLYLDEHQQFPVYQPDLGGNGVGLPPDWGYGGADFPGPDHEPVLADDRPINSFLDDATPAAERASALLYRCPADAGIYPVSAPTAPKNSILGDGETCFSFFGTSYRANPYLLDGSKTGLSESPQPLAVGDVTVGASRLLLTADPVWWHGTRPEDDPEADLDASWHGRFRGGNMLAMDGSVRFQSFTDAHATEFDILPRPDLAGP